MKHYRSGAFLLGVLLVCACAPPPQTQTTPLAQTKATAAPSSTDRDLCTQPDDEAGHDHRRSLDACSRVIQTGALAGSDLARIHNDRGAEYEALHDLTRALQDYQRAVELDPDYALAWSNISDIHAVSGRWEQALAAAERAVEAAPESASGYRSRTYALRNLRKFELARSDLDIALALAPKSDWTVRELGWLHLDQGDYDQALVQFEKAKEMDPDDPENHYSISYVLIDLDRDAEALQAINLAIDAKESSGYYNLRGFLLIRENGSEYDLEAGIVDLKKSIELDPNSHFPVFHLAAAYAQSGDGGRAVATLREGFQLRTDLPKARRVVRILLRKGLTKDAEAASALINRKSVSNTKARV